MHHCRFCAEREAQHEETAFCAVCQAEIDDFFGRFHPQPDIYAGTIGGVLIGTALFLVSAAGFIAVFTP